MTDHEEPLVAALRQANAHETMTGHKVSIGRPYGCQSCDWWEPALTMDDLRRVIASLPPLPRHEIRVGLRANRTLQLMFGGSDERDLWLSGLVGVPVVIVDDLPIDVIELWEDGARKTRIDLPPR